MGLFDKNMASDENEWFSIISVILFLESLAKLKGGKKSVANRGEARNFPEVRTVFKIFCLFVCLQQYAGYFKVTPHSHWASIKIAG